MSHLLLVLLNPSLDHVPCRLFWPSRVLHSHRRLLGVVAVTRHHGAVVQLEHRLEVGGDLEAVDEGVDRSAARERRQPLADALSSLDPQTRGRVTSLADVPQFIYGHNIVNSQFSFRKVLTDIYTYGIYVVGFYAVTACFSRRDLVWPRAPYITQPIHPLCLPYLYMYRDRLKG